MVRMARDTRSRGCVSTLSAMARSFPRAGQHLCGITQIMEDRTNVTEFILLELSMDKKVQILCFLFFWS